jgi:hypothetical protein
MRLSRQYSYTIRWLQYFVKTPPIFGSHCYVKELTLARPICTAFSEISQPIKLRFKYMKSC